MTDFWNIFLDKEILASIHRSRPEKWWGNIAVGTIRKESLYQLLFISYYVRARVYSTSCLELCESSRNICMYIIRKILRKCRLNEKISLTRVYTYTYMLKYYGNLLHCMCVCVSFKRHFQHGVCVYWMCHINKVILCVHK